MTTSGVSHLGKRCQIPKLAGLSLTGGKKRWLDKDTKRVYGGVNPDYAEPAASDTGVEEAWGRDDAMDDEENYPIEQAKMDIVQVYHATRLQNSLCKVFVALA